MVTNATIRSVPIFSHPFPERVSIGTTLWCGWIQIRPVFSDLKILCGSRRWAFVMFHRLKQFEHHMRRPTRPVKLDDLRGAENKPQEKGLKPQRQVTPLTWNPKKNDDFLETGNLLLNKISFFSRNFYQNFTGVFWDDFPMKNQTAGHVIGRLGNLHPERHNGLAAVCSHLSITPAAVRCELSMQRNAAVFFVLRNWWNQRSNCKIGATSSFPWNVSLP